jgi:hypothetical protein
VSQCQNLTSALHGMFVQTVTAILWHREQLSPCVAQHVPQKQD